MEHYAGIDVSLEQSSVCVVDETGRIVREAKIAERARGIGPVLAAARRWRSPGLGSKPDPYRSGCMLG